MVGWIVPKKGASDEQVTIVQCKIVKICFVFYSRRQLECKKHVLYMCKYRM